MSFRFYTVLRPAYYISTFGAFIVGIIGLVISVNRYPPEVLKEKEAEQHKTPLQVLSSLALILGLFGMKYIKDVSSGMTISWIPTATRLQAISDFVKTRMGNQRSK
ncbi:hypothetical protein EBU71_17125 [bacterium]|nr:hypothetical protein [Candidatus Elulimicrobium humile]